MQVDTANGPMQVAVPDGLTEGATFMFQVPGQPTATAFTEVQGNYRQGDIDKVRKLLGPGEQLIAIWRVDEENKSRNCVDPQFKVLFCMPCFCALARLDPIASSLRRSPFHTRSHYHEDTQSLRDRSALAGPHLVILSPCICASTCHRMNAMDRYASVLSDKRIYVFVRAAAAWNRTSFTKRHSGCVAHQALPSALGAV